MRTPLPDDIALYAAAALKVRPDYAVIADERIGLQHNLPGIAGIGERLHITAHASGKHQFPGYVSRRAKAEPLKDLAVL